MSEKKLQKTFSRHLAEGALLGALCALFVIGVADGIHRLLNPCHYCDECAEAP